MEDIKGFIPAIVGLFIFLVVLVVIASSIQWVVSNPFALITAIIVVGGFVYLVRKGRRARTRV